jgi:hypothetical protein
MAQPSEPLQSPCTFCGAACSTVVPLTRFRTQACVDCVARLGRLLSEAPEALSGVWPALTPEEEDHEPEPRVQGADGRVRELREVTAELKKGLDVGARTQLAEAYGLIGLRREQVQECAHVLGEACDPALREKALEMLFSPLLCAPTAVEQVRSYLFPT